MSVGSQVYTVRISDPEHSRIAAVIAHRNEFSTETPWTFSDFIRKAIEEKIKHMERSRRSRTRKEAPNVHDTVPASYEG